MAETGDQGAGERAGPLGPLTPLGLLLEPVYRGAIGRINRRRDAGQGVERLGVPVISVGNLSVGGTGKTPMVMHVVGTLLRAGRRPCIAMRGYAARGTPRGQSSDEADSYRRALPGVEVVARPDRATGVRELLAGAGGSGPDCVVLDDGFQHRQVARELDIVLVDASRSPLEDRLLPAGWLREPVESLARAHAVVLTHAELVDERGVDRLAGEIERASGRAVAAVCRHAWTHLERSGAEGEEPVGLEALEGQRVLGCSAIGHPGAFERSLRSTVGARGAVETITLRDHDPYVPATVRRIADAARRFGAGAIIVTDKDWSKLRSVDASVWPCPVLRPHLAMLFDRGGPGLEAMVLGAAQGVRAAGGVTIGRAAETT